jgi:hypothetical protein
MENGVRLPLGFVTRIRDRRFVEKYKSEDYLNLQRWQMANQGAPRRTLAACRGK